MSITDSIILIRTETTSGMTVNIKLLKKDRFVYSVLDYDSLVGFEEAILSGNHIKVKKWDNSWYDFLLKHLRNIKLVDKNEEIDNMHIIVDGTSIYFNQNEEMVRLGGYSNDTIYDCLDDIEAENVLNGLIKNEKAFWESDNIESKKVDDTVYSGKDKCDILRNIRKKIAEANNIEYEPAECHHEGPCRGTCPVCDIEVKYLDAVIQYKKAKGETINLNGIAKDDIYKAMNTGNSWDYDK